MNITAYLSSINLYSKPLNEYNLWHKIWYIHTHFSFSINFSFFYHTMLVKVIIVLHVYLHTLNIIITFFFCHIYIIYGFQLLKKNKKVFLWSIFYLSFMVFFLTLFWHWLEKMHILLSYLHPISFHLNSAVKYTNTYFWFFVAVSQIIFIGR